MLPLRLSRTGHQEQATIGQRNDDLIDIGTIIVAEHELALHSETHARDDRRRSEIPLVVRVPGDRVLTTAIEVEKDGVELYPCDRLHLPFCVEENGWPRFGFHMDARPCVVQAG